MQNSRREITKREICKRQESRKLSSDSEKHSSIHIQEAAAECKASAKKAYRTLSCKWGITQQLKHDEGKWVSLLTEQNM